MPTVAPRATSSSTQQLVMSCQGLVRSIAWKIHRKISATSVELDDLVSYGQLGLVEAANQFDPQRGNQFTTFAYLRIRGAILDGLSKMSWFQKIDYARGRYEARATDLLSTPQPHSNNNDLEAATQSATQLGVIYLFCQFANDPDQMGGPADPLDDASTKEMSVRIRQMIDRLDDVERRLMTSTYFDGMSLKDAAEQMGYSKSWASRTHARILKRFADQLCESE
ncbi:MAG: sigma-70 family RNA polymerase sigma factor [Planctomycetaceae bacterium]|nr:sigma-70 family RNA polymerase sigma factor [Planctomycetaceae bacterium]MCB9952122.1 sigma-70 family RNA polymerase sigma factor [Planctomycetaceae bacterium]